MNYIEENKPKPRGYWNNKENCKKLCDLVNSLEELKKMNGGSACYSSLRRNFYLDELTKHWKVFKFKDIYWNNKDKCRELCNSVTCLSELKKLDGGYACYNTICKNKWFDLTENWITHPKYFDNINNCKKLCDLVTSRIDLLKMEMGYACYYRIKKYKWIKQLTAHWVKTKPKTLRYVYTFIFPDVNIYYVGLTGNLHKRTSDHLRKSNNKRDNKVYNQIQLTPNYIFECDNILYSEEQAKKIETSKIKYYKTIGTVLNSNNGGSLGRMYKKYTNEVIINYCLKCKSRKELVSTKEGKALYNAALKYKLHKECFSHFISERVPKNYWTLERCIEYTKNINTYKELITIEKGYSCYSKICKENWFMECFNTNYFSDIKPKGYWTLENCIEYTKDVTTYKELMLKTKGHSCFNVIHKNNWFKECSIKKEINTKKPSNYWTLERCIEFTKNIYSRIELKKINKSCYQKIITKKWDSQCFNHFKEKCVSKGYWTLEKCQEYTKGINSYVELTKKEHGNSCYTILMRNKWRNLCFQPLD